MMAAALIVAGGTGSRMGGDLPKQYLPVGGIPILRRTVQAFLQHPDVEMVQVVIHPDHAALYEKAIAGLDLPPPVMGGMERRDSVLAGLEALAAHSPVPDVVLIQDAARPFTSASTITNVIQALETEKAVLPLIPVRDTLKRVENGYVHETVAREALYHAQTPQGFRLEMILDAHRQCKASSKVVTDDTALAEMAGIPVHFISGSDNNFKITTPMDIQRAEQMVSSIPDIRVGQGFDVHRFLDPTPGKKEEQIMLCGVSVPSPCAIEAHSDGDVGLHALTDALLGTIAAEDIGHHFPPSDPRWKDADSSAFLLHAAKMVHEAGGRPGFADLTIIAETPKVGPYRDAMRQRIAELLELPLSKVSVKATTTEKLGFTGRTEGLAAQACVTVHFTGESLHD